MAGATLIHHLMNNGTHIVPAARVATQGLSLSGALTVSSNVCYQQQLLTPQGTSSTFASAFVRRRRRNLGQ